MQLRLRTFESLNANALVITARSIGKHNSHKHHRGWPETHSPAEVLVSEECFFSSPVYRMHKSRTSDSFRQQLQLFSPFSCGWHTLQICRHPLEYEARSEKTLGVFLVIEIWKKCFVWQFEVSWWSWSERLKVLIYRGGKTVGVMSHVVWHK